MPKSFSEYHLKDLIRFQPLVHSIKSFRYKIIDKKYFLKPDRFNNMNLIINKIKDRNILLTVAFEDPVVLELHLRLCSKFLNFDVHIVADNSFNSEIALRNRTIVENSGGYYIWLPENPWTKKGNPSRSHGIALNWLWQNVLKPGEPKSFGFLDHDIFPTCPDDPFRLLENFDFFGDQRTGGSKWFLWAGYCFFNFAAIKQKSPDFGLDWFAGLDTGGANWSRLFRHVDPRALPQRPIMEFASIEGVPMSKAYFERRGTWIHEVGVATDPSFRAAKRAALIELLSPFLD